MEQKCNESIEAALKLLEEAAQGKKDELKAAMSDKFTNLRSLFVESESTLLKSLNSAKELALKAAADVNEASVVKAREFVREVDKGVHENPWAYIAGSALAGLLLGYILGGSRK